MSENLKGLDYKYRDLIFEIAEKFDSLFLYKELTYVYRDKDNSKKQLVIKCNPSNLMHLCGILAYCETSDNLKKNANEFFHDALDKKLIMTNIWYKEELLVSTKLHALMTMEQLLQKGVGVCGAGKFELLAFDNAIRTGKIILAMTYIANNSGDKNPNSAIDLRTSKANTKVFESSCRVTSIATKNLKTKQISTVKFVHTPNSKKKKKKKER